MKMRWGIYLAILCVNSTIIYAKTPSFQGLGDLPGRRFLSSGLAISDDGSVIAGHSSSDTSPEGYDWEACRWTQTEGMVGLGYLPSDRNKSSARGISGDGAVLVGYSTNHRTTLEAFRWSASTGMVGLGDLPGGDFYSQAADASADGSVVVGVSNASRSGHSYTGRRAFRWTASSGMVDLGAGLGSNRDYGAEAVSADGSVVVGRAGGWDGPHDAFRWTQADGMVALGHIPDYENSYVMNVSSDGETVVGYCESLDPKMSQPFRWTQQEGMIGLGNLPSDRFVGYASGVSADGSTVIGSSLTEGNYDAFIWNAQDGMSNLKDVLIDQCGLDLTGWRLTHGEDVNGDGTVICGHGINPAGDPEGWVAVIPEPGTLSLLALGGFAVIRRRRS